MFFFCHVLKPIGSLDDFLQTPSVYHPSCDEKERQIGSRHCQRRHWTCSDLMRPLDATRVGRFSAKKGMCGQGRMGCAGGGGVRAGSWMEGRVAEGSLVVPGEAEDLFGERGDFERETSINVYISIPAPSNRSPIYTRGVKDYKQNGLTRGTERELPLLQPVKI